METARGSPLPELFHSKPASVFPLYHVLADYGEFAEGVCVQSVSSDPLRVDGIVLRHRGKLRIIVANFTPEPQLVSLQGLKEAVIVRLLDESNAAKALLEPEAYRLSTARKHITTDSQLLLRLLPYAVATINE